jgi:hypothetical protein
VKHKPDFFVVICKLSPWWVFAWGLASRFGLYRIQRLLENNPSFTTNTGTLKAVRPRILKDGEVAWSFYTANPHEVHEGWPDVAMK